MLERDSLLKEFKLSNLNSTVNFDDVDTEMYRIELEQIGDTEYAPKPFKIDQKRKELLKKLHLVATTKKQIDSVTARLFELISNLYTIDDADVKKYI